MVEEYIRIYEDGRIAFRVGIKITKAWDPWKENNDKFWKFCTYAYNCLPNDKIDARFKPPLLYKELPYLKIVDDYEKLME